MATFTFSGEIKFPHGLELVAEAPEDHLELYRISDEREYAWASGAVRGFHYWMLLNGVPMGYAKILERDDTKHQLELGDVEIRGGFRGRGYVQHLFDLVNESTGKVLHSTGGYTPEGFKAISKRLPMAEGFRAEVCYRSQSFVAEWDELIPLHP